MQISKLRHRVALQRYVETQDPNTGAIIKGWVDVATFYASVEGVSGREFLSSRSEQAATTWRITIRYRNDIMEADRLLLGNKTFDIQAILPDNKRTRVTLMCESGVTAG